MKRAFTLLLLLCTGKLRGSYIFRNISKHFKDFVIVLVCKSTSQLSSNCKGKDLNSQCISPLLGELSRRPESFVNLAMEDFRDFLQRDADFEETEVRIHPLAHTLQPLDRLVLGTQKNPNILENMCRCLSK